VTVQSPSLTVSLTSPLFFYDSNVVVVFGGTDFDLGKPNDIIYSLNLNLSAWTTITPQLLNYSGNGIQDLSLDYFNAPSKLFGNSSTYCNFL
jgi:hypothetical protein